MPAIYRLFDLLDFLASRKHHLSAVIYKKIIFLLVENHEDTQMRSIILENMQLTFTQFSGIPLGFLIEPFLKQLS